MSGSRQPVLSFVYIEQDASVDAEQLTVELRIDSEQVDRSRADQHAVYLVEAIREMGVPAIGRVEAPAPLGARASSELELGAIIVGLGASGATLPMLIGLARDWLGRRREGSITLKIGSDELHLTHVSTADQQRALDSFLERHRA